MRLKQINEIETNKYVEKCTPKQIRFTNEFKIEVLKLVDKGFFTEIFLKHYDFPEYVVKSKVPERSYTRWKNIKKTEGLIGLIGAKKGRPKKDYSTPGGGKIDISKMNKDEKLEYLKAEVAYLKELHKITYGHYPNKIIYKLSSKYNIEILCNIAKISVSGYYKYKKNVNLKLTKELVLKYKMKYGYIIITMKLKQKGISFNHKKVLRIMYKYDLLYVIRKKNPYAKIRKATKEHNTVKNILNREFAGLKGFTKIGTDISYLKFKGK